MENPLVIKSNIFSTNFVSILMILQLKRRGGGCIE